MATTSSYGVGVHQKDKDGEEAFPLGKTGNRVSWSFKFRQAKRTQMVEKEIRFNSDSQADLKAILRTNTNSVLIQEYRGYN